MSLLKEFFGKSGREPVVLPQKVTVGCLRRSPVRPSQRSTPCLFVRGEFCSGRGRCVNNRVVCSPEDRLVRAKMRGNGRGINNH